MGRRGMWRWVAGSPVVLLLAACGGGPSGPSGDPIVTSVNGATLPSGQTGSTVVISGSNFGNDQTVAQGQVLFSNGSGGTVPATIAGAEDWSPTLIVTTVPAGAATGDLMVQTVGGSSTPITFTLTTQTAFSPSTISWSSTSALPAGLSGHALAAAALPGTPIKSVVYVAGGADSTNVPGTGVVYASASGSGTLNGWTGTLALPAATAFAAAVVATPFNSAITGGGYLYVIGGDSTAGGKPVARVYKGTLDATGAVTAWAATTVLPAALHSVGAVIFNGSVYVLGGSGTGNVPVATVYRATIGATGDLGSWQTLAGLPFKRSYFGFGINGLYLYTAGGDSGAVSPNDSSISSTAISDVAYAQIDVRTGALTSAGWTTSPNKLKKVATKLTAVAAGGSMLVTGGLYNGASTGSTEETYAALNADGSVGTFGGATGSNTINSSGGGNLFNHAATGYVDTGGTFHVLVVGGDDVNNPTKKHKTVFYH